MKRISNSIEKLYIVMAKNICVRYMHLKGIIVINTAVL